ncbi:hypothetical protein ACSHWI_16200, partial [Methylococcus sp. S2T]|uniref:hypothetical protein n=1 Tax=Methylococcus sp. S2T TaxID=3438967 RepID=UPI003ED98469
EHRQFRQRLGHRAPLLAERPDRPLSDCGDPETCRYVLDHLDRLPSRVTVSALDCDDDSLTNPAGAGGDGDVGEVGV